MGAHGQSTRGVGRGSPGTEPSFLSFETGQERGSGAFKRATVMTSVDSVATSLNKLFSPTAGPGPNRRAGRRGGADAETPVDPVSTTGTGRPTRPSRPDPRAVAPGDLPP